MTWLIVWTQDWNCETLSLEGNISLDQDADENGNLPSSTIEIVKKNSEKEAKLRIEGTW